MQRRVLHRRSIKSAWPLGATRRGRWWTPKLDQHYTTTVRSTDFWCDMCDLTMSLKATIGLRGTAIPRLPSWYMRSRDCNPSPPPWRHSHPRATSDRDGQEVRRCISGGSVCGGSAGVGAGDTWIMGNRLCTGNTRNSLRRTRRLYHC